MKIGGKGKNKKFFIDKKLVRSGRCLKIGIILLKYFKTFIYGSRLK